jgi:YesN/AraC family two-component response regulator
MKDKTYSVLIADDDPLIRQVLRLLLRGSEYDVIGEAANGDAALAMVQSLQPDFVLLDIKMPGLDGLDVLKRLRDMMMSAHIIIVSADSTSDKVQRAVAYGADGYIIKPFNAGVVLDAFERCLSAPDPRPPQERESRPAPEKP